MIFVAQIDPVAHQLKQGLGFSTPAMAEAHMEAHASFLYLTVDEFVSPTTHQYINGLVLRRPPQ